MNELKRLNISLQSRLDNFLGRLLSKYVFQSSESNIFFPLHDRRLTENINYSEVFNEIKKVKGVLDNV